MQVQALDKTSVKLITSAIKKAVGDVEKQFGITIQPHGGTFTEGEATTKFRITLNNPAKDVMTVNERTYVMNCEIERLPKLHSIVRVSGTDYKIMGWKPRARKWCIVANQISNGKSYLFPVSAIKNGQLIKEGE